jgi:vacuolar-type H+-ATPase subunit H
MLEIIEDVLQAEEEADRIVREARQEAARIRNEFSEEESRRVREAQASADQRLREQLAAIRNESDARVAETELRLRENARVFAPERLAGMEEAVARSVRLIRQGR